MFPFKTNKVKQFLIALGIILLVAVVCFLLSEIIGYKVTALILLMCVSLLALFLDVWPVLLTSVISALIWNYFFIPPRFTLFINNTEDALLFSMYFIIAMLHAVLTSKIRQFERIAREKEEKANSIKLYNTVLNSLSHELRTPISAIIGSADNLLSNSSKIAEEDRRKIFLEIFSAGYRLNTQVENLLNMSRLESGVIKPKLDWQDINELIYSVVNQFDDNLKGKTISVNIKDEIPLVKIDLGLMQQVLYNLINNAVLYTKEGASISVEAQCKNRILEVLIKDNGGGFPADEIDSVFDKFYRLKNSKPGGVGLGLSIVKGLLEICGGSIILFNNSIGGATFKINLPVETTLLNE